MWRYQLSFVHIIPLELLNVDPYAIPIYAVNHIETLEQDRMLDFCGSLLVKVPKKAIVLLVVIGEHIRIIIE